MSPPPGAALPRLTGVLGWPVAHSISPALHNAAFRAAGRDWIYLPFAVPPESLGAALEGLRALGAAGVNLTLPHKAAARSYLSRLSGVADSSGAVNTVVVEEVGLVGHNTDGAGLLRALAVDAGVSVAGTRVVVLGAGGMARAACAALADAKAEAIVIAGRTPPRVESLRGALFARFPRLKLSSAPLAPDALRPLFATCDLLLQCTSVGLTSPDFDPALPLDALPAHAVVHDAVYGAHETPLVRAARARGLRAVDGLPMLVYQAALSHALWTGAAPDESVMLAAARDAVARQ